MRTVKKAVSVTVAADGDAKIAIPADADRVTVVVNTAANVTISVTANPVPTASAAVWKAATLTGDMSSTNGPIGGIRIVSTGDAIVEILATGD